MVYWLKLDIDGGNLHLRINQYRPTTNQMWDDTWCRVYYSLEISQQLKYRLFNDESLQAVEVDILIKQLEKLLNDELTEVTELECIEPYFQFKFFPRRELLQLSEVGEVSSYYQVMDSCMEWKTFFWNDGAPTDNYIVVTFYHDELLLLLNYLYLIIGRLDKESDTIQQMLQQGYLYKNWK